MKKVLRVLGLVVVVGLVFAAIITSTMTKPPVAERVWDERMTLGSLEAKNHYIVYSDVACPYCVAFENAILENQAEFERYLEENDILFEVRLADFLYEFGETHPIESRYSAEAVYCARDEGRFWDYYAKAVERVWDEYFGVSGKAAFSQFNKLEKDYWTLLGEEIGLSESFRECVMEDKSLAEVEEKAGEMSKLINGMPYFKFNSYISGGFDLAWGYDYVKMYLDAGLGTKK